MKSGTTKLIFLATLLTFSEVLSAQAGGTTATDIFSYALIAMVALLVLGFVMNVSDNMLAIEAKQTGADKSGANFSIFPKWSEIFRPKLPDFAADQEVFVLGDGHNIMLEGQAEGAIQDVTVDSFAVKPPNFVGMSPIPKVEVEVGSEVAAGDVLFFDKKRPNVKYVAPVSGEIAAINRGAKRSIAEVVILADKEMRFKELPSLDINTASREEIVNHLLSSGGWSLINQRPFDVVPDAADIPRDIFISTFDTAPLAPDLNLVVAGKGLAFQKGLDVLNRLTEGSVCLGLNAGSETSPSAVFTNATGVEKHWFMGKHPAGNVGVQIHHVKPISPQDKVWTLNVQDVITLGNIFLHNRFDAERVVALTGAELTTPKYVRTYQGANIGDLLKFNVKNDHVRVISGDVLSGKATKATDFLNFRDDQVTVIEEGDYYEMFGWLVPIAPRPTISGTFPNFLYGDDYRFKADTNAHGERRAFVVTGDYEKVLPMDIYLQHLMKAIMIKDFERMEGLGIHELSEEDVALCEFVCVSKQPLQQILREGQRWMRAQG